MATVQQTSRIITVKIARQNADGTGKKFMTYKVPVEKWTTVLDAVLDVKKYMDHSMESNIHAGGYRALVTVICNVPVRLR